MTDQEFRTEDGFKVRTIEREAAGGLVEVDLRDLKPTADGTFLVPSKDLVAAGRWALSVDVAQAKKEGRPVPERDDREADKVVLVMNELMAKLPALVAHIKDAKNARPHPVDRGLEAALAEAVTETAREVLETSPEMKDKLQDIVRGYLEDSILGKDP